jgi:hypothetical protein
VSSHIRRTKHAQTELQLFETAPIFPDGFRYEPELISAAEEQQLVHELKQLLFKPFEFQGFVGKRLIRLAVRWISTICNRRRASEP